MDRLADVYLHHAVDTTPPVRRLWPRARRGAAAVRTSAVGPAGRCCVAEGHTNRGNTDQANEIAQGGSRGCGHRRGGRPREAADRRGPRGGCLAGPLRSLHRVFDRTRGLVRPWRRGAHEEGRDVMMSACDPCLGGEDDERRNAAKRKESPCPLLSPCSQRSLPEGLCCERRKRGDRSTCVSHSAIALLLSRKNRRPNETIRARFYQHKTPLPISIR